jgi:hypothetical protein
MDSETTAEDPAEGRENSLSAGRTFGKQKNPLFLMSVIDSRVCLSAYLRYETYQCLAESDSDSRFEIRGPRNRRDCGWPDSQGC